MNDNDHGRRLVAIVGDTVEISEASSPGMRRLNATLVAVEQLSEGAEDDGSAVLLCSRKWRLLLGVAKRNRDDLDAGLI